MKRLVSLAVLLTACDPGAVTDDGGAPIDSASSADAGSTACVPFLPSDPSFNASERVTCTFGTGDSTEETLGLDRASVARIPLRHLIIVMEENRSFDHYFGTLPARGRTEVNGIPEGYTNPDRSGNDVAPFHLSSTRLEADPPHQWDAMHAQWNGGAMDGFVRSAAIGGSDGHYAIGYYDDTDLPFYDWLSRTYAMSDAYFASVLSGTWANRNFLYASSNYGVHDTGDQTIEDVPTIFDQLDGAGVSWRVYTDGWPRQDSLGWLPGHRGLVGFDQLLAQLADGTLPSVSFVDPAGEQDEHPDADVQGGEAWSRSIYEAARQSPLWESLAIFFTYDESGGLFDHTPPPVACPPSPDLTEDDRLGIRVPLMVVSPWARPGYVSHEVASHTSIARLVQLLFDLPALTARDASSNVLLDLFDFDCDPDLADAPESPPSGTGGC